MPKKASQEQKRKRSQDGGEEDPQETTKIARRSTPSLNSSSVTRRVEGGVSVVNGKSLSSSSSSARPKIIAQASTVQRGSTSSTSASRDKTAKRTTSSGKSPPQMEQFVSSLRGTAPAEAPSTGVPRTIIEQRTIAGNGDEEDGKEDEESGITSGTPSLYNPEERDSKKEEQKRHIACMEYVRHELFPKWKFFTSPHHLVYDDSKGSIVLKICNDLNVKREGRMTWWDLNKNTVVHILNQKRNEVTAYVKQRFIGECGFCLQIC
jgi:hypothetical protein